MNFNVSSIAFYPSRAAQAWRSAYYQRKISVVVGENLPPFLINDAPNTAPTTVEIYNADTDTLESTRTDILDILVHTSTVDGRSVTSWIYQGTSAGIFGFTKAGYYYLKIGSYYSDVIKFGVIAGDYVKLNWQYYDDIITVDGSLISKYVEYQQIFETILWHPSYNVTEEGKENNGIFYATQQTTKKTCGFSAIVNEAQVDTLNLTRMADTVQIEARTNGVIKMFNTNTFEIKSKWESDEVASIECEFDLFNIIRKYQISNEKPEPLPVPVPPPPPSLYVWTGTVESGTSSFSLKYGGTTYTIPCTNGQFTISYDTPFSGKVEFLTNKNKIKTLDFSQGDDLSSVTELSFNGMTSLESIDFTGVTFDGLTTAENMFAHTNIRNIALPDATFANCTNANSMFYVTENTDSIVMPNATFASVTNATYMFCACWADLISAPLATFDIITDGTAMFSEVKMSGINMPLATFENVTNGTKMFSHNSVSNRHAQGTFNGSTFPSADFSSITNGTNMFANYKGSVDLTSVDLSGITNATSMFEGAELTHTQITPTLNGVTNANKMFKNCTIVTEVGELIPFPDTVTFADVTNCEEMFSGHNGGFPRSATFASATNVFKMFEAIGGTSISLLEATFASCTSANKLFYNCADLTQIMMPKCTFASLTNAQYNEPFQYCNKLERIMLAEGGTMGLDSGSDTFQFAVKCPKINKNTCISILKTGKAKVSGTPDNQFKILLSVWNSFNAADQTAILNAAPSGWTVMYVNS